MVIDPEIMMQMVREGKNAKDIASHFGCSRQAVEAMNKRWERRIEAVPDVTRSDLSRHNINTVQQLREMNKRILEELDRCQRLITRQDKREIEIEKLEDEAKNEGGLGEASPEFLKKLKELSGATVQDILRIQSNIISISAEVRKQIELQVKIYETIYNVQMVAEFQEEVMQVLGEADKDIRDAVIGKLKQRRSMRGLLRG
jgi:transposase